jgi:hypothetical protein
VDLRVRKVEETCTTKPPHLAQVPRVHASGHLPYQGSAEGMRLPCQIPEAIGDAASQWQPPRPDIHFPAPMMRLAPALTGGVLP